MSTPPLKPDPEELRAFFADPVNQAKIRKALEDAEETCRRLDEARKIDPAILHQPMTI